MPRYDKASPYQRFLCPQNALGKPVTMSIPPKTPKPGLIFVSKVIGVAVGVADAVEFAVEVDEALVVVAVTVTLNVV